MAEYGTKWEASDLSDLSDFVHLKAADIEKAMRKAARSAGTRIKNLVITELRKRYQINVQEFGEVRVRLKAKKGALHMQLWIGSNPVPIEHMSPRVVAGGVQAGGKLYENAFILKKRKGRPLKRLLIFRRIGKKRYPIERLGEGVNALVLLTLKKHWPKVEGFFFSETRKSLGV